MGTISIRTIRRRAEELARELAQSPAEIQKMLIDAHEKSGILIRYDPNFDTRDDLTFTEPALPA